MALLILGLSHRSAPMPVLDAAALDATAGEQLREAVLAGSYVNGMGLLSTCNRLELIADVSAFHGGLADLGSALVDIVGIDWQTLAPHLYAHYDERAMEHLLHVTCGLDSMALGEAQILGQVRQVLSEGQRRKELTGELSQVLQQALRVGKRAHAETELDSVARSLLGTALDSAPGVIGDYATAKALVVGAGAMSGLVVASLAKLGLSRISIVNRSLDRAERLAAGVGGRALALTPETLETEIADADLIVSCTGARGAVITPDLVRRAPGRPAFIVDLALPRDVAPEVGELEDVTLIGLDDLAERLREAPHSGDKVTAVIAQVRAIIAQEMNRLGAERRAREIGPAVAALRSRAAEVLELEIARLRSKIGKDADERVVTEAETAMRRVADKILHTPTVRAKELAADAQGVDYAALLGVLFDLPAGDGAKRHVAGQRIGGIDPAHVRLAGNRSDEDTVLRAFGGREAAS